MCILHKRDDGDVKYLKWEKQFIASLYLIFIFYLNVMCSLGFCACKWDLLRGKTTQWGMIEIPTRQTICYKYPLFRD